jgi:hypothetical protein
MLRLLAASGQKIPYSRARQPSDIAACYANPDNTAAEQGVQD